MQILNGLKGQRVLVTAGAAGIGYAIAATLAGMGARVAICDISEDAIAKARAALPELETCVADVAADADVDRMFAMVAAASAASTRSSTMPASPVPRAVSTRSIRPTGGAASISASLASSCVPDAPRRC